MQSSSNKHIAQLAEICAINGIRQVVLSPGSRNAPLIIAFESHPGIETILIHDERSAAFFALGLAEASSNPVALCCTSGSAVLNYAPAISEAYYRQIPLFVLTADRPPELVDQGDGQTIRQKAIYSNYIKSYFQLPVNPTENDDLHKSVKVVERAITDLISVPVGPVHLNIPLVEPLYNVEEYQWLNRSKLEPQIIDAFKDIEKQTIADVWATAEKKLLIIGQNPSKELLVSLRPLLELSSLAILVENTSNLAYFEKQCHCIDRTLAVISEDELEIFAPDLLITCEGAVISKRVKAFLRKYKPKNNWRIGEFLLNEDTYQSLTMKIAVKPSIMFGYLASLSEEVSSNFGNKWKQKDLIANALHHEFLQSERQLSDLKATDCIFDFLPENSNLHLGNSSVVRYSQLFDPLSSVHYYSNRGVSGIDGSLSTATGIAFANRDKLNTVILGDISFMYDSNALWNNYLSDNLRIIVINNGGGGIFKILPDARNSVHNTTFFSPTDLNIDKIAAAFNLNYSKVESLDALENNLTQFFAYSENNRPKILEIDTKAAANEKVLDRYFKFIKDNSSE